MKDTFQTLPSITLVAQVRDRILGAVTSGELLPGQRIIEGNIAQRLGVSRGPVREAARLLEQQGLLVSQPRRGFFVRTFEAKEILDLYELREWVEVAAVKAAAHRASASEIELLKSQNASLVTLRRHGGEVELIEAIVSFHRMICAMSHNSRLMRLFDEIAVEVRQILSVLGVSIDGRERPVEVQTSLLEALQRNDATQAGEEMRRYVRQACAEVMEHYNSRQAMGIRATG